MDSLNLNGEQLSVYFLSACYQFCDLRQVNLSELLFPKYQEKIKCIFWKLCEDKN